VNTFQDIAQLMKFFLVQFVVHRLRQVLVEVKLVFLQLGPKVMLEYFQSLLGVGQTLKQFLQMIFVVQLLLLFSYWLEDFSKIFVK